MAEIRLTRVEQGQTKIRNVPIAVTPEGFWCCPSPVVFQKTVKTQNPLNKTKPSSPPPKTTVQKKQAPFNERKPPPVPLRPGVVSDDQRNCVSDTPTVSAPIANERGPRPKIESLPRKVAIEFGEPGTSDMKVVLLGKQGFCVKLSVHKKVLVENSSYFADKLSGEESDLSCLEIDDCDDVEIYVETVGLMYCKEMKQRLIKQSVSRVLRIIKVIYSATESFLIGVEYNFAASMLLVLVFDCSFIVLDMSCFVGKSENSACLIQYGLHVVKGCAHQHWSLAPSGRWVVEGLGA